MKVFSHIDSLIKNNQGSLLKMISAIRKEKDLKRRCVLACEAASFAMLNNSDIYVSDVIEAPFLELAEKIDVPLQASYVEGTVLHVATEVYLTGGHTRCIERWIQLMNKQKHSCYLLNQGSDVPELLRELVSENQGELIVADKEESMVARAKKLRAYASSFQYVVLHIHMNDPISLIAFGTNQFKRPIIYFNHADHIFWFGASIADYVADLSEVRHEITKQGRNIERAYLLGIPTEDKINETSATYSASDLQISARSDLQLPLEGKVIFSSGDAHKYSPIGRPNFADIIREIAAQNPDAFFCLAGPKPEQELWKNLEPDVLSRVRFTGYLDYATEYPKYLAAADMVLDSYPVNGSTSSIDAIEAGKPILALEAAFIQDFLARSDGACHSLSELVTKVTKVLNDAEYARGILDNTRAWWKKYVDSEKWKERCETLYSLLPTTHSVYSIIVPEIPKKSSPVSVVTVMWTRRPINRWKRLRRWMCHYDKKVKEWCLFGCRIPTKKYAENIYKDHELN